MGSRMKTFAWAVVAAVVLITSNAHAQDGEDEQALFTSLAADALIVLDLSGSMNWSPAGGRMYISQPSYYCDSLDGPFFNDSNIYHSTACTIDISNVPKYSDSTCSGPFYRNSGTGHTTNCSRLAIAKRALFDILDDNDDGVIDAADESTLNIRFGYMRFYNCSSDSEGSNYSSGCNTRIRGIGSKYSQIYCNASSTTNPASSCTINSNFSGTDISGESAVGGTPLAGALSEAKRYLDDHKGDDPAKECRQKFAILITDGADTYACNGDGTEDQTTQYKRRRETVAKAKLLADAGYKVFVVGFGATMPHWLRHTLNWAAYYGGTDNPLDGNVGEVTAYDPATVSACQNSATASHNIDGDGTHFYAAVDGVASNDPGETALSGYAFLATSATDLTAALKKTIEMIREVTYSFSSPSVSSQRSLDENFLYEASFQYISSDPFWKGHLKKFEIGGDGNVGGEVWNSGDILAAADPAGRNLQTCKAGGVVSFTTANISRQDLGVSTDAERDAIVGFFRGETAYNKEDWKLGDIFHSNPMNIGTPNVYFSDVRDNTNPSGFETFRANHVRTSANGLRIILVGGNDGQFHGFKTGNGGEFWSFIPPNFLTKLKNISHSTHPAGLTHQYFVDGPISAADVWTGSGDGRNKAAADWKTYAIFGEGRGGDTTLWSSSTSCDSEFNQLYTATYSNYCGYYAFDFTNTMNPQYKWIIKPNSAHAPYLGEPWSKVVIGRVIVGGNEKWVGFFGGGFNASDCSGAGTCDLRGKGFFVVDLADGTIYWSYTKADNANMKYSLTASPAIVDTDGDGFLDTVYIGDLGSNLWRFKLCTASQGSSCTKSDWGGGLVFDGSSVVIRPIYNTPTVAKDGAGNIWVYWGTGDKTDPTATPPSPQVNQEKFYALKDTSRSGTYGINDLQNITSGTYSDISKAGWYINITGLGEKILAEPTIFNGVAYFSTYTPPSGSNPCEQAGTAQLYGVNFVTGAAALQPTDGGGGATVRSMTVGAGIPSAPVLSIKPPDDTGDRKPDIYMTVSGGGASGASTQKIANNTPTLPRNTNLLYWKDRRLQ